MRFSIDQLVNLARMTQDDLNRINRCRRQHNKLGFGYQLSYVKMMNRFPVQVPFEIVDDILNYASIQLGIPANSISSYSNRRETIAEHQDQIRDYCGLERYTEQVVPQISEFLFQEACRLEETNALMAKAEQFLREQKILTPSLDTLRRIIGNQRKAARDFIFAKIVGSLSGKMIDDLDALLDPKVKRLSDFSTLKQAPLRPSPIAMLKLIEKLKKIESTAVLTVDLSWLNNNLQRSLTRYTQRCDANKMREVEKTRRYAALTCFLAQNYRDTVDCMIDTYHKLINKVYNHAQNDIDDHNKSQRKQIRESLATFRLIAELILDESLDSNSFRQILFSQIEKNQLAEQMQEVDRWLNGKYSNVFNLVVQRFSYIRQFSPLFLKHIRLQSENGANANLFKAIGLLRELNANNKRKLPDEVPMEFVPKKLRPMVVIDGEVNRAAWECALLTAIRDEIKAGNLSVVRSKRFGRFEDFFISDDKWRDIRADFFNRARLPMTPEKAGPFLTKRLNLSFDQFLERLPNNAFVSVDEDSWHLSSDPSERLDSDSEKQLEALKNWLASNMREIKLPQLLIEVNNELKIARHFMTATQQENPDIADVCAILATIMAHGCNIGPYTMSQITDGVSYSRIKYITDWLMTEEAQRGALAQVVNAISQLDITQAWGQGKTSSSDGQRFAMRRKVLQQTYSPKFNDFALEFYSFVADNYAPFFSLPIECTDRDAPYVLDGLLYNESDLPLEEHYTDTHGYTENNFAAFAMLGRRFSPRIRGLQKQRIYRIDTDKDYQALTPLVCRSDRTIHIDWILEQWDRMGQFYASLECGHATASTAMKRLNGFTGKNNFYRANRELGRIFKTDHILQYMSDKPVRQRTRRGLLKGEQIHALARDLNYGKRGRLSNQNLQEQKNSCSCLTLIMACIIYWQAKEINRAVLECDPEGNQINLKMMEHVSPITWDNVILYGEYVLNRGLIEV